VTRRPALPTAAFSALCGLAALASLAAPAAAQSAEARADELLSRARALARQGLLSQVEATLAEVPADADAERQGHAELLRGNVGYERGRFADAAARYRHAASLLEPPAAAGVERAALALNAARDNLAMATSELARHESLDGFIVGLRAALAGVLAVAGAAVLWIDRRARAPLRG
jgi:hypothetical protein